MDMAVVKSGKESHKSAHGDPVGMCLAAGCALDLESVVEWVCFCVFWLEVGQSVARLG